MREIEYFRKSTTSLFCDHISVTVEYANHFESSEFLKRRQHDNDNADHNADVRNADQTDTSTTANAIRSKAREYGTRREWHVSHHTRNGSRCRLEQFYFV